MNPQLHNMLRSEAEADRSKALLSLKLLSDNPAGIGDHTTDDFWNNANQALELLASADDRLTALEKYFPDQDMSNQPTLF
tara:strand:- start:545 stop:784 length:240 start_codon:yes stop_codon:yes gene_type:complete